GNESGLWSTYVRVAKTSPLLRTPLLIVLLLGFSAMPVYIVYLKKLLHIPSDIVGIFAWTVSLGSALSLLFWGKLADTIGFRPLLKGLLFVTIAILPLHLLLAPFAAGEPHSWSEMTHAELLTVGVLLLQGLIGGALAAGSGIATTSILHYQGKGAHTLETMNVFQIAQMGSMALVSVLGGWFLDAVALPWGDHSFFNGILHFDWIKGYLIFAGLPLQVWAILLLSRLPNLRPYFGVYDFFQSFSPASFRGLWVQRHIYHADADRRARTAEWLGQNTSPMGIEPLTEMLTDPTYDVRVSAIRALARTESDLAGEKLLGILEDKEKQSVADHAAWALGELRYQPATEALQARLSPNYAARIRAMSARALARLGTKEAVPQLAAILADDSGSQHLLASACWSLLHLNAMDHRREIISAFARLTEREDRYELSDAICGNLNLTNNWLLRHTSRGAVHEALITGIEAESSRWQREREALIQLGRMRDAAGVLKAGVEEKATDPLLQAILDFLKSKSDWHVLHCIVLAWLLWGEANGEVERNS
ncbi:MAG: HEAT repeat domain-containing protein, partial [Planctomycetota bacterium]